MIFQIMNFGNLLKDLDIGMFVEAESQEDAEKNIKETISNCCLDNILYIQLNITNSEGYKLVFADGFNFQIEDINNNIVIPTEEKYILRDVTSNAEIVEKILKDFCKEKNDFTFNFCKDWQELMTFYDGSYLDDHKLDISLTNITYRDISLFKDLDCGINLNIAFGLNFDESISISLTETNMIIDREYQKVICIRDTNSIDMYDFTKYSFYIPSRRIYYTEYEFVENFRPLKFVKNKILNCDIEIKEFKLLDNDTYELKVACINPNQKTTSYDDWDISYKAVKTFEDYLEEYGDEDSASAMQLIDQAYESSRHDLYRYSRNKQNDKDYYTETVKISGCVGRFDICKIESSEEKNIGYFRFADEEFRLATNATESVNTFMYKAQKRQQARNAAKSR